MTYIISYECRNNEGSFSSQFNFEAEQEPTKTDKSVIEAALKDSMIFHQHGVGGVLITSISLAP